MAKAQRFFSGTDTYGRQVERAQSVSGQWFARHTESKGRYGNSFTRWYTTEEPAFETTGTNAYSGEEFTYDKPVCLWGWNKMYEYSEMPRVRLPS